MKFLDVLFTLQRTLFRARKQKHSINTAVIALKSVSFLNLNTKIKMSTSDQCISLRKQYVGLVHAHFERAKITRIIIHMKKLLASDWLRAVQFKCNTSAKSVIPVQKV